VLKRILAGDGMRRSRLHNYNGQLLDLTGLCYLPRCLATIIALKVFGLRPELPWLGFRAIRFLDELIEKDWKILEFGSGMSTLWFAKRCSLVVSIESDKVWYEKIEAILREMEFKNVDYLYRVGDQYHSLHEYRDSFFDLVLVDGFERDKTMRTAIEKVKHGGYIYLDNSDVPYHEHQTARGILLKAASSKTKVHVFNDLYPTQLSVNEGILVQVT
jgi:predicted O-methyltransferase YrrM